MSIPEIIPIDEERLARDVSYRVECLREFLGIGADDLQAIRLVAPRLLPLIPIFVDGMYAKLFRYDVMRRYFMSRHARYEGEVPASANGLRPEHSLVLFRKAHLSLYLEKLFAGELDETTASYFDRVGQMHTSRAGAADIHVPLMLMGAMLGFLSDAVLATVQRLPLDPEVRYNAVRAFNKMFWLQNDLITRHYGS